MRRIAVLSGLVVFGLVILLATPQLGIGQMRLLGFQDSAVDNQELELEISILKTINAMELSEEQMLALRDSIVQIRSSQGSVEQAKLELREFLLDYNGSRDELAEAMAPFEERVAEAEQTMADNVRTTFDGFRDVLTMRQGDILRGRSGSLDEFLIEHLPQVHVAPHGDIHSPDGFNVNINGRVHLDEKALEELEYKLEAFEEHFEDWGERIGEWGERFGEQIGRIVEHSVDPSRVYIYRHAPEDYDYDYEYFTLPDVNVELRSDGIFGHGMIMGQMLEHLDVWERVLTQKLERIAPEVGGEDSI